MSVARSPDSISITLSRAEALTLFEMLARQLKPLSPGSSALCIEHRAEAIALSNLLCRLEQKIVEPFEQDGSYSKLFDEAHSELLKHYGTD